MYELIRDDIIIAVFWGLVLYKCVSAVTKALFELLFDGLRWYYGIKQEPKCKGSCHEDTDDI
jgi:hypothetical protein